MALENLMQNIEVEEELIKEVFIFFSQLNNLERLYPYEKRGEERKILIKALESLIEQIKIINNSIPEILNYISPFKQLEEKTAKIENLVKIDYIPKFLGEKKRFSVTLEKKDKEKFLEKLSLSIETLDRIKKIKPRIKKEEFIEFKKSSFYAKLSNKFFRNFSNSLIEKGYFSSLNLNLRKANMPYLLVTYLSAGFFSVLLSFLISIPLSIVLFVLFDKLYYLPLILLIPAVVAASFYLYPYLERKSIEGRIEQEVPFVTIHMSAIAGSGIEPTQIFKIIALGEEYPNTRREFKKIINQINVYGYDLITALKNTARETSSRKLSELLSGMASSISGGSSLTEFLDKRAETLLFDYRLEREKYTKTAETFMDIYISIMIAAPMIMTLLLVLISVSGLSLGMSLNMLTLVIILIIALINIIFLVFLHLSQPS